MIDHYHNHVDALPPEYRGVAETIGREPALRLVQALGGEDACIPKAGKI